MLSFNLKQILSERRKDIRMALFADGVSALLLFCAALFAKVHLHVSLLLCGIAVFFLVFLFGFIFLLVLSEKVPLFVKIARFAAIGTLSTSIEFSVINLLFLITGLTSGIYFSIFKAFTFLIALTNSYFLNGRWTFESKTKRSSSEFLKFFAVNIVGLCINVGVASFIVNGIGSPAHIHPTLWANLAVAIATLIAMVWNFTTYSLVVFKEKSGYRSDNEAVL